MFRTRPARRTAGTALTTSVAALALMASLAGCNTAASTTPAAESTTAGSSAAAGDSTFGPAVAADAITEDTHYDGDDLTWDAAEEIPVTLADGASSAEGSGVAVDGNTVTLSAAGTYRLSGSLADGQVVVAAGKEDVVRVILDGVDLASSTGSPFVVTEANEVLLFLAEGSTNTLADAATYADTAEDAPNAALYSKADLTIAGTGALTVKGNAFDGIVSKDGLVLAAGNVTVEAADDGIKGKDYLVLAGGRYNVTAGDDGVKATNDEEEDRGWSTIYGGELTVSAGDDGVKAETSLTVQGGTVTVADSVEGMEARHITINGGTIDITASDDGVNAAGGSTDSSTDTGTADPGTGNAGEMAEPPQPADGTVPDGGMADGTRPELPDGAMPGGARTEGGTANSGGMAPGGEMEAGDFSVTVTGGQLTINADGDGLDSNGDATITGGTVIVHGPTNNGNGALDVNGTLTVDGGTVIAAGSAGMMQAPAESSAQSGLQVTFDSAVPAGTLIQVADADGTIVASFVPAKDAASVIYSAAGITAGNTYTVYTGGTEGSLDGAAEASTVTAGNYTQGFGAGFRG